MILTRSNWTNKKIYLAGMLTLAVLIVTGLSALSVMVGLWQAIVLGILIALFVFVVSLLMFTLNDLKK